MVSFSVLPTRGRKIATVTELTLQLYVTFSAYVMYRRALLLWICKPPAFYKYSVYFSFYLKKYSYDYNWVGLEEKRERNLMLIFTYCVPGICWVIQVSYYYILILLTSLEGSCQYLHFVMKKGLLFRRIR